MPSLFKGIRFNKTYEDIISIESNFPQALPLGFINAEINYLFDNNENFATYTPSLRKRRGFSNPIGISKEDFLVRKNGYLDSLNKEKSFRRAPKIKYLNHNSRLKAKLAFTTFLSQAYILNPFFEKMKIPFIFTLYPGGGFGINNKYSDSCLKDIFKNKYFRKVIVNHNFTKDYLIRKKLCEESDIEFIYGVPLQFKNSQIDLSKKLYYKNGKNTFDICFVAFKYDNIGLSKGFDLFIESIKKIKKLLCNNLNDIHFHIIGNYDKEIIDIREIEENIHFYGPKPPNWLENFYYKMDISVNPVRANIIYPGIFDGFPMGVEQSLFGVALFTTDEMNLNNNYFYYKKDEFIKIEPDSNNIAENLLYFYENTNDLYKLANKGREKTLILYDFKRRMSKIQKLISESI